MRNTTNSSSSGRRSSEGRLVYGLQPVREVLRTRPELVTRLGLVRAQKTKGLTRLAEDVGVAIEYVEPRRLDALCRNGQHQGAALLTADLPLKSLSEIVAATPTTILALDGIQDPQNFGATVRSAVGLANAPVLWPENASAPLSPATFRASAGAIEHASLCRVPSLPGALHELAAAGYVVVGLDAHADLQLRDVRLSTNTVLVIGSEGKGMARATRQSCTKLASLVLPHTIDSLNASVAAAVALYEVQSQSTRHTSSATLGG